MTQLQGNLIGLFELFTIYVFCFIEAWLLKSTLTKEADLNLVESDDE